MSDPSAGLVDEDGEEVTIHQDGRAVSCVFFRGRQTFCGTLNSGTAPNGRLTGCGPPELR